jgi:hypothetical protein
MSRPASTLMPVSSAFLMIICLYLTGAFIWTCLIPWSRSWIIPFGNGDSNYTGTNGCGLLFTHTVLATIRWRSLILPTANSFPRLRQLPRMVTYSVDVQSPLLGFYNPFLSNTLFKNVSIRALYNARSKYLPSSESN